MTHNEITAMIGSREHRVFLQNGFYCIKSKPKIHKHNYTEIHVISEGDSIFTVNNQNYAVSSGNVFVVPPNTYHYHEDTNDDCLHSAFQIDLETDTPLVCSIDPAVISNFLREAERARESQDHTIVSAYISLICSHFETIRKEKPKPSNDYGFSIREFFTQCYNRDVKLCDLAEWLHISERQAERLVIRHTGRTFREELSAIRIDMAKHLIATTDMPLGEVADYVGYRSYAGFWKAMKKYGS